MHDLQKFRVQDSNARLARHAGAVPAGMSAQQAGQLLLLEAESLYCPDAGGVIDGGVTVAIRDGRILWRGRRESQL